MYLYIYFSNGSTSSSSLGPTGQYGAEGHYGLNIIGNAQIQNCNASFTCCDGIYLFIYLFVYLLIYTIFGHVIFKKYYYFFFPPSFFFSLGI